MESIKVLAIGDPHFKVGNIPESDDMVDKLIKVAKNIQPKFIVVLGDILHRHEKIHVSPLMRAEKMVRLLSQIAPTFVLVGNHDRPNNSTYMTDEHPFNAMKLWPNTYIADDNVIDAVIADYRFLFVPYVFPGKFDETLLKYTKTDPYTGTTAIFCHQEFYKAKMGAILSQVGDKWPTTYPLVISGHVHDYDRLQPNLIYTGTPMQHAFGDKNDKTVSVFTFSPDNTWSEDRIDLGLTKRIIVYLSPEQIHTYEPPLDKLVKIVIKGDSSALKAVSKLDRIKELKKLGVKISFKTVTAISESDSKKGPVLRMSYKDRLYTEIRSDEKQLSWFNKLFK
jgi:DNA repair exonuclease SbcCD nuclease subunit